MSLCALLGMLSGLLNGRSVRCDETGRYRAHWGQGDQQLPNTGQLKSGFPQLVLEEA